METESKERPVGHSPVLRKGKKRQTWLNRMIRADVLDFALNVGYMDGMILDKVICMQQEDGWLVIVKAHRNGRQRVAYVAGDNYADAMELAADFAAKGVLTWQMDSKPSKLFGRGKP